MSILDQFPPGPWTGEEDFEAIRDAETGYLYNIRRNSWSGNLCGYVALPETHPLYEKPYMEPAECLEEALEARRDMPLGETPGLSLMLGAILGNVEASPAIVFDVHGGITFSGRFKNSPEYFYGFDCGHHGDLQPAQPNWGGVYRDFNFVREECLKLARQLKAVENYKGNGNAEVQALGYDGPDAPSSGE